MRGLISSKSSPLSTPHESVLKELGVNNSSVFLTNATLWVEGITDRKYIRTYLDKYQLMNFGKLVYEEDIHYSFVEYAGSNLAHWSWSNNDPDKINASKICSKALIIADKDVQSKGDRLKNLESQKIEYHLTLGKEIENMIPSEFLISQFGGQPNSHFKYENHFSKNKTLKEICNHYQITKIKFEETGTPSSYWKNLLPDLVHEFYAEDTNNLPDELYGWVSKIYSFIESHNK